MNHADVRNQMADYLEGDLPLGSRALVDAHLDECAECATEIEGMRDTIALLRSLPEVEVPAAFSSQVMRRVRAGEDRVGFVDGLRLFFETLLSPRVLAPISVAMLATGVLIGTGGVRIVIGGENPQVERATASGSEARIASNGSTLQVRQLGASAAGQGQTRGSAGEGQSSLIVMKRGSGFGPNAAGRSSAFDAPGGLTNRQGGSSPTLQVADSSGRANASPMAASRILSVAPRTAVGIVDGSSGRSLPTADEWLAHLERNPADFADRLAALSLAEHELWVESLASHAVENGRLEPALAALRGSASQRARLLAEDFAHAAQGQYGSSAVR